MAEAEVVALREAAEASKREILTVTKDKEAYSARMEVCGVRHRCNICTCFSITSRATGDVSAF